MAASTETATKLRTKEEGIVIGVRQQLIDATSAKDWSLVCELFRNENAFQALDCTIVDRTGFRSHLFSVFEDAFLMNMGVTECARALQMFSHVVYPHLGKLMDCVDMRNIIVGSALYLHATKSTPRSMQKDGELREKRQIVESCLERFISFRPLAVKFLRCENRLTELTALYGKFSLRDLLNQLMGKEMIPISSLKRILTLVSDSEFDKISLDDCRTTVDALQKQYSSLKEIHGVLTGLKKSLKNFNGAVELDSRALQQCQLCQMVLSGIPTSDIATSLTVSDNVNDLLSLYNGAIGVCTEKAKRVMKKRIGDTIREGCEEEEPQQQQQQQYVHRIAKAVQGAEEWMFSLAGRCHSSQHKDEMGSVDNLSSLSEKLVEKVERTFVEIRDKYMNVQVAQPVSVLNTEEFASSQLESGRKNAHTSCHSSTTFAASASLTDIPKSDLTTTGDQFCKHIVEQKLQLQTENKELHKVINEYEQVMALTLSEQETLKSENEVLKAEVEGLSRLHKQKHSDQERAKENLETAKRLTKENKILKSECEKLKEDMRKLRLSKSKTTKPGKAFRISSRIEEYIENPSKIEELIEDRDAWKLSASAKTGVALQYEEQLAEMKSELENMQRRLSLCLLIVWHDIC